jgi:hypothetical protein
MKWYEKLGDWIADTVYAWRVKFRQKHPEVFHYEMPKRGHRNRDKSNGS